jgi:TonB family protein
MRLCTVAGRFLKQKHSSIRDMRVNIAICALAILCGVVSSQEHQLTPGAPDRFLIGRHTFIDVGPPNDFYELFLVTPNANGALIDKVTLTPATDACFLPAKVEITSASLAESPAKLLATANPCTIPEKELRRELKRCKGCLVFSGANVAMQVQCGAELRIVRSDILDKDMFDANPNTPKHTSWTMQLLAHLDQPFGPGVLDKPMFPTVVEDEPPVKDEHSSPILLELSAGKYDVLFKDAPDRPSDLYRAAQIKPAIPSAQLQSSTPFQPIKPILPKYPLIARAAHIEGAVTFKIAVDANGGVRDITFDSGSPLLREVVKEAVSSWRFTEEAFNQQVQATVRFALNCPNKSK